MRAQSAIGGLILAALAMTAEAAEDRLTPLLRFVPPAALAGPQDAVSFVDLAAVRSVLADQVSPTAMETWSEADRALATLMRATNLPPMLADYAQNDGASGFAGMRPTWDSAGTTSSAPSASARLRRQPWCSQERRG